MRGIPLLLVASGCRGIFGLEPPVLGRPVDAATDIGTDIAADAAAPVTKSYIQGQTYMSVRDTWIDGVNPGATHPGDGALRWRDDRFALIRFDAIFMGSEIPTGSTIESATLIESSTNAAVLYESLISWADTVSYDTFGVSPGVSSNELRRVVAAMPSTVGAQVLDVTSSLESWSLDPTLNQGWIVVAAGSGVDTIAGSSNSSVTNRRPRLTVTYTPP